MHTERGFDRIVNFSDAVVAIAITLIVLPLVDSARDLGSMSTTEFLSENAPSLYAAVLSFVVIATFWWGHHQLFERVTGYSRVMVRLNMLWLASIVFLPVPTQLLVSSPSADSFARILYIGTMLVSMVSVRLMATSAERNGLVTHEAKRAPAAPGPSSSALEWIPVALVVLALVLTVAIPVLNMGAMLVVLLSWPIRALVTRVAMARSGA